MLRQLLEHVSEVGDDEAMTVRTPPVRDEPVRQHDHVSRLLFAVDDDSAEAVSLDPRHRSTPNGERVPKYSLPSATRAKPASRAPVASASRGGRSNVADMKTHESWGC